MDKPKTVSYEVYQQVVWERDYLQEYRDGKKPIEIPDDFGNIYDSCPTCKNSLINYMNKKRQPPYCMMCGQAICWRDG